MKSTLHYKENSVDTPLGKRSLSRIIFVIPMLVATMACFSFLLYYVVSELIQYQQDNEKLKKEFPLQQRHELKYRILTAKDYVEFASTHQLPSIKSYFDKRFDNTRSILERNEISSQTAQLPVRVIDTLLRIYTNSKIHIAVINSQGSLLFLTPHGIDNEKADKNDWKEMNSIIDKNGKYATVNEWYSVVQAGQGSKGVICTKAGKELELFAYIDMKDSLQLTQELVLDSLSKIRYENNEYVFVNTFDGHSLISKGVLNLVPKNIINGTDTNWQKVFADELNSIKHAPGDYISYNWKKDDGSSYSEKVSYISSIPEWKWLLGTGMHTTDIEPVLQSRKDELRSSLLQEFTKIIVFLILLLFVIYFITRWISNLTSSNIKLFVKFLKNAAISLQPLDESKVHFKEFHVLAKAANHMISERDRIASDLATEQSRLKYIIDAIPDLIFFKDIDSLFVGGNRAFLKYAGRSSEDIKGCSEYDLFTKANADTYLDSDKRMLQSLEASRTTEWVTYSDGHKVLCDTLKTLYFDANGNVLGFIGISRDITEMEETRQRLIMAKEKAEESDRLKTAFLANMSHEIRTPMNAIIGFSDLLSDDFLDPADREDYVSKIKLSGESLMNIINDIIDIAKIEAGQLKISDSECNVDQLLADLFGTFTEIKSRSNKNALEIKVSIPQKESPLLTITDPLRLQQVLTNLLSNALKFTEFGEIEFGYKIEENNLHFAVKDTGIGILRSKQQLLFQRFSQVDSSTTRKYGGTGLGLAISRNIIELMGGTIWLESEPGQGSTFHFTLPYRKVLQPHVQEPVVERSYQWKGKTILIAEDMDQNYLLMEAMLKFTDVSLLHACNGQQAIDLVNEEPGINLVLMDIQLPIKTGYEAIQEIRVIRPELPIISFTAFALPREREKSIEAGCVDYLNKPIKPEVLLSCIQKHML
ncbi:MAG: cache domain-containing protein [Bacteroidetes bacterium]|nr:cache domain-containing protein [Bacteroidota bacterium]